MTDTSKSAADQEDRMPSSGVRGFGNAAVRAARARRNLTQGDLALLLGVSSQAVAAWESGATAPSPAHLVALARALGIAVDDLLRIKLADADLASLRDRAGLTGTDAAAALGIQRSALSGMERGYRKVPPRLLEPMANLYHRAPAEITAAWERGRAAATRRAQR